MADSCTGVRYRAHCIPAEKEEARWERLGIEANSKPKNEPSKNSILYRGWPPPSSFRSQDLLISPRQISKPHETIPKESSSVDWIDILAWGLLSGAVAGSTLLIQKGLDREEDWMIASGEGLAVSSFVWGLTEIVFRVTGAEHDYRFERFAFSLGMGLVTGVTIGLVSEYANPFEFNLDEHQFRPSLSTDQKNPTTDFGP